MVLVPALGDPPPPGALARAAAALTAGEVVALPTDTVYGLAADPFLPGATDRIFEAKRRPREASLPVLVRSRHQALDLVANVPASAATLMERFWPGALTLVLPARAGLQADLGEDELTVGVRCPAHPVPLALCASLGPLATTSANRHGASPPGTAAEVEGLFGDEIALVLDGGPCRGTASTVVDCTGQQPKLLREGRIGWQAILAVMAGSGA